jgi:hypothetical protein
VEVTSLLIDPANPPAFEWSLDSGRVSVGEMTIDCSAAFLRYDVFSGLSDGKQEAAADASAWYAALSAVCAAAGMFTLNRDIDPVTSSKPAMLVLAKRMGLGTPRTVVTNSRDMLAGLDPERHIAKPVAGGSYVMSLLQAVAKAGWREGGTSSSPALVQPMLSYPERRIYRVGNEMFAFDIGSSTLDSRLDSHCVITPVPLSDLPAAMLGNIGSLTDSLRCDFCAIDMKTDPESGELLFLELNNGPMFMGYDRTMGGTMAEAMVRYLVEAKS